MLHLNRALASKRARSVRREIQKIRSLDDSLFNAGECGIDWDGLEALVEGSDMKHRDEVLEILRTVPEQIFSKSGKWVDGRRHRLEMLRGGRPWNEMRLRFFPLLRSCEIVSFKCLPPEFSTGIYNIPNSIPIDMPDSSLTTIKDNDALNLNSESLVGDSALPADSIGQEGNSSTIVVVDSIASRYNKSPFKTYLALKTNLLYDGVGLPNLGFELQRGQWSLSASALYGWWRNWTSPHINAAAGDVAVRRWFGRCSKEVPLAGHHIGAIAQMAAFDLKGTNAVGIYAPWGSWSAGVEYGYSFSIGKSLTLDLSAGAGYAQFTTYSYERQDDCDILLRTNHYRTLAPIKADVSLIWILNR